jgi:hypothetical protein
VDSNEGLQQELRATILIKRETKGGDVPVHVAARGTARVGAVATGIRQARKDANVTLLNLARRQGIIAFHQGLVSWRHDISRHDILR